MSGPIIYLARHGESEFSKEHRIGGNTGLTAKGIDQAESLAEYLGRFNISAVYCSTLRRAVHTAQIIHSYHPGTPLIRAAGLDEIASGRLTGLTFSEFEQKFPDDFAAREKDKYNWRYPGGENYADLKARAKPVLDVIKSLAGEIVIVGHQGINRAILGYLLDLPEDERVKISSPHDALFEIDLRDGKKKARFHKITEGIIICGYESR